jgi:thioredoxin reductase
MILMLLIGLCVGKEEYHENCIVGAGAAGLQLGYFYEQAQRDYIIIEKGENAGTFFTWCPRRRRLISINKKYTGKTDPEFNLRHDWNSLLSHDPSMRFTEFSEEYFPHADDLVEYMRDFAKHYKLKINYETTVLKVSRDSKKLFRITAQHQSKDVMYSCRTVVIATGVGVENKIGFGAGEEYIESYVKTDLDPERFKNKHLLIIGKGNSAFEIANEAAHYTSSTAILSQAPIKIAFMTHYVGDVRGKNLMMMDQYQLKSLDGLFEGVHNPKQFEIVKNKHGLGYIIAANKEMAEQFEGARDFDEWVGRGSGGPFKLPYDIIISCVGFNGDQSLFDANAGVAPMWDDYGKYPKLTANYESVNVPGLYFAGTLMHGRDYAKTPGGFIHGFRYLIRYLFRHLDEKFYKAPLAPAPGSLQVTGGYGSSPDTASVALSTDGVSEWIMERLKHVSSYYQMYGVLADVLVLGSENDLRTGRGKALCVQDIPIDVLPDVSFLEKFVSTNSTVHILVLTLGYGRDFKGAAVLGKNRAVTDPKLSNLSNFLHPILRRFAVHGKSMTQVDEYHMSEEFNAEWNTKNHWAYLRGYLSRFLVDGSGLKMMGEDSLYEVISAAPSWTDDPEMARLVEVNPSLSSCALPMLRAQLCSSWNKNDNPKKGLQLHHKHPLPERRNLLEDEESDEGSISMWD